MHLYLDGKLCVLTAPRIDVIWVLVPRKKEGFNATANSISSNLTIIVGHIADHAPILALRRPQVIQAAGWC